MATHEPAEPLVLLNRSKSVLWMVAIMVATAAAGCGTLPRHPPAAPTEATGRPSIVIYVVRRRWHTDIGFRATDLRSRLAGLLPRLPGAGYLLFGFGDRHYLMHQGGSMGSLLGALLPGAGVVLVTGLPATPGQSFGADAVHSVTVTAGQARALEDFVWTTLARDDDGPEQLGSGPYAGSLYYAATVRYSGLHTCNTWTAEALMAAGLPIHSFGVEFSGQVWRQLR